MRFAYGRSPSEIGEAAVPLGVNLLEHLEVLVVAGESCLHLVHIEIWTKEAHEISAFLLPYVSSANEGWLEGETGVSRNGFEKSHRDILVSLRDIHLEGDVGDGFRTPAGDDERIAHCRFLHADQVVGLEGVVCLAYDFR